MATNDQKAQAGASEADALAKAEAKNEALQATFDKLLAQSARLEKQLNETQQKIAELAQGANRDVPESQLLRIRNTSVDAERATQRLADIWDRQTDRLPGKAATRTYKVSPKGGKFPPAIVTNCLDEGDAKAAYAKHFRIEPHLVTFRVDLATAQDAEAAVDAATGDPADPAGDAANAA